MKRKGFTMLELIVATFIFALAFGTLLATVFSTYKISIYEARDVASVVKTRVLIENMQEEFESATRMQSGSISPSSVNSIAFKKYFSLNTSNNGKPHWVNYTVNNSNGTLTRDGRVIVDPDKFRLKKLDDSHYYYMDFWTASNLLAASNHTSVPKVAGFNDYANDFWKWRLMFSIDGYPIVMFATRRTAPIFDTPYCYGWNGDSGTNYYSFSLPMDTSKYGSWSGDFNTTTDIKDNNESRVFSMSSYNGVSAKETAMFNAIHQVESGWSGTLADMLTNKGIQNAVVSCYPINESDTNHPISTVTNDEGNFTLIGVMPPFILYYAGDDNYAQAIYYYKQP